MSATLIEIETEDLAAAARQLVYDAVDPIGVGSRRLWSALSGCGGMAGTDPGGTAWATAYDRSATAALNAAVAAGEAAGQLARMLAQTASNYESADVHSSVAVRHRLADALSAVPVVPHLWLPGCVPPSAAGGSSGGGPPGWGLVSAAVGCVWPNGHQDRLRRAAHAWGTAATGLRSSADGVLTAARAAQQHRLPEADDIFVVCTDLSNRLSEIADLHDQLADSCRQLADRIDQLHGEVVGELKDLLEWTAGIEAGGALLSLVSFGAAEVPAQAAEAARIARTADLVAGCIQRFLSAVHAFSAGIGLISERAELLAARLRQLLDVPLLEPALAGIGPIRVLNSARELGAATRLALDANAPILRASEVAGGHTIERHVALTDAELIARNIPQASTFTDLATAEAVTARNVAAHAAEIRAWLNGASPDLIITSFAPLNAGRVYIAAARRFVPPRRVLTKLTRHGKAYFVVTSYLLP